jgi:hypothetical protein
MLDSNGMKEKTKEIISGLFVRESKKYKPNVGTLEYYRETMIDLESEKQDIGFK